MKKEKKLLFLLLIGAIVIIVGGFFILKDKLSVKKDQVEKTVEIPPVKIVGENLVDKKIEMNFVYDEKTNTVYLKDKRLEEGVKFYMPFRGRVVLRFEDLGRRLARDKFYTYYFGLHNEEEKYYLDIVGPLKPLIPYNFYVLEKGAPFAEVNYKGFDKNETFPIYISVSGKSKEEAKKILQKLFPEIVK